MSGDVAGPRVDARPGAGSRGSSGVLVVAQRGFVLAVVIFVVEVVVLVPRFEDFVLDHIVDGVDADAEQPVLDFALPRRLDRSEEHTSELQSLMRISYAVFCLKKK